VHPVITNLPIFNTYPSNGVHKVMTVDYFHARIWGWMDGKSRFC
jgi:hypothetical protein